MLNTISGTSATAMSKNLLLFQVCVYNNNNDDNSNTNGNHDTGNEHIISTYLIIYGL